MKKRIYLAGPMSGIPEFNYPAFREAALALRQQGYKVFTPDELDDEDPIEHTGNPETGHGVTYLQRAAFLRRDFGVILEADMVVLLPGWESSTGANCEVAVAHMAGIPVREYLPDGKMIDQLADLVVPRFNLVKAGIINHGSARWSNPELPL